MKFKIIPFALAMLFSLASCKQKSSEVRTVMIMDSVYTTDKNVSVVGTKDTVRLVEAMKNFEENPNINGADIDAAIRVPSAEIQYLRPGDTVRLEEIQTRKE